MSRKLAGPILSVILVLSGAIAAWMEQREPRSEDPSSTSGTAPGLPRQSPPAELDRPAPHSERPSPRTDASDPFHSEEERRAVRSTIASIRRGPPFPIRKDGTTFRNREGLLPRRESGYYREFTVPTPGESTRGARRIVAGRDADEYYYTRDHYGSFVKVDVGEQP